MSKGELHALTIEGLFEMQSSVLMSSQARLVLSGSTAPGFCLSCADNLIAAPSVIELSKTVHEVIFAVSLAFDTVDLSSSTGTVAGRLDSGS